MIASTERSTARFEPRFEPVGPQFGPVRFEPNRPNTDRAVVERTIGKLKFWHALEKKKWIGRDIERFEQVVFVVCNLVNHETFGEELHLSQNRRHTVQRLLPPSECKTSNMLWIQFFNPFLCVLIV